MKKRIQILILLALTLPIPILFNSCKVSQLINPESLNNSGGGTVVGNPGPVQTLAFAQYSNSSKDFALTLCLHKIYFLEGAENQGQEKQIFNIGKLVLDENGTLISKDFQLQKGQYQKIEILVKPECLGGHTVELSNTLGDYSTHEDATLKFSGPFQITSESLILLNLNDLIDELKSINKDEDIIEALKSFDGSITVEH